MHQLIEGKMESPLQTSGDLQPSSAYNFANKLKSLEGFLNIDMGAENTLHMKLMSLPVLEF